MHGKPTAPTPATLLHKIPDALEAELFSEIVSAPGLRIERIVSTGQTTPDEDWYDQDRAEWVMVLRGHARLLFEGENAPIALGPGDHLLIPARCRHRVAWTTQDEPTVWLAVHFDAGEDVKQGD